MKCYAVFLEEGKIVTLGNPDEVIRAALISGWLVFRKLSAGFLRAVVNSARDHGRLVQGLNSGTPVARTSSVFRVTNVRPW